MSAVTEAHKRLYYKRKLAGLCVICGKNPARNERTSCAGCGKRVSYSSSKRGRERWGKDPDFRNKKLIASTRWKAQQKDRLFEMYGNECFLKDELCNGALQFDHVNGRQFDLRAPEHSNAYYAWLLEKKRDGFVTLCSRHNKLKGGLPPYKMIEYGYKLQRITESES